jgi:hypothetical protein
VQATYLPAGLQRGTGGALQKGAGLPAEACAINRTGPEVPSASSKVNLPAATGFALSARVSQPVHATCLPFATVQRIVATSATGLPSCTSLPVATALLVGSASSRAQRKA